MGIDDIIGEGLEIINKFIPDPALKAQAQTQWMGIIDKANTLQAQITQQYAQSSSFYMAGARPAILWLGVAYIFYSYLFVPITMYICYATGHPIPKPPALDDHLYELVTLLLGVSGLRTYEKKTGIA